MNDARYDNYRTSTRLAQVQQCLIYYLLQSKRDSADSIIITAVSKFSKTNVNFEEHDPSYAQIISNFKQESVKNLTCCIIGRFATFPAVDVFDSM